MINRLKPYFNLHNTVLAVAMLVAASWVWGTIGAIQRNFALQQQVDALQQEVAYRDLQNETLKFQQKYYLTDEFVELSARERLNKALPDEKLLILPANTVEDALDDPKNNSERPIANRSNFEQWLYFLFGDK